MDLASSDDFRYHEGIRSFLRFYHYGVEAKCCDGCFWLMWHAPRALAPNLHFSLRNWKTVPLVVGSSCSS